MNSSLILIEIAVVLLGLGLLMADLWTPAAQKRNLGYVAVAVLGLLLVATFFMEAPQARHAFGGMYVLDSFALFFKRFFLIAGIVVLLLSIEFSDRISAGISEYYSLMVFALSGMLFAASANDFVLMFVSLELITITFYVLTSFQRGRLLSLEAGIKYLVIGALSTGFTVYGIALIFGTAKTTNFEELRTLAAGLSGNPVFLLGLLLVFVGLGFKMAAFPFQIWAPDVYQGAPAPTTAFLAVGSKAAGVALLLRVLFEAAPQITVDWTKLLMVLSAITILYGNLCAIPQRNLKRLLGYSSIAHAGYLLLGFTALNVAGASAVMYYLLGYLFTVLAAFAVITLVTRGLDGEDISAVAGLSQRSPLLAFSLALAMISLAGIPPLAGFFGKFLLMKAVIERGGTDPAYYWLLGVLVVGVVISFYYYLGVVRAIYWSKAGPEAQSISVPVPMRITLGACIAGMFVLGLFPNRFVDVALAAAKSLKL